MTITTNDLDMLAVHQARDRLAGVRDRLRTISRTLNAERQQARGHTDRNLTPEGLDRRRDELVRQARERAGQTLTQLQAQLRSDGETVRRWVERERPTVGDDPGAQMRNRAAWDRARMTLDSGRSLPDVLAGADADTALALRAWAPAWMQSQASPGAGVERLRRAEPDVPGLLRSVDDRLAELHGGRVADAVKALRELDVLEAGFAPVADDVRHQVDDTDRESGGALRAAIASQDAERQAAAGYAEPAAEGEAPAGDAA